MAVTLHDKTYKERKSKHSTQWVSEPFWKDTFWLIRRKERSVSSLPACKCAPQRPLLSCPVHLPTVETSTLCPNREAAAPAQPAVGLQELELNQQGAPIPGDSTATNLLRCTALHSKTAHGSGFRSASNNVRHCLDNFQNILRLLLLCVIYFCRLHSNSAFPLL